MSEQTKRKVTTISLIIVFVSCGLYMITMFIGGYDWLAWVLGIVNVIAGPACLIAYIREIRKGIFSMDDEEAAIEDGTVNTATEAETFEDK